MLRNIKDLFGYKIHAKDGNIGEVYDFFFDDETWAIRYLVADVETWLLDRKVLISPEAFGQPEWESRYFFVTLTQQQVKNSPNIDTHKPISRQHQIELHNYYGWPLYWHASGPYTIPPVTHISETAQEKASTGEDERDSHLRSMREVKNYHIHAIDGEIGHVSDFLVDDKAWIIRYIVVDTGSWLPGKKILIAPLWIHKVCWEESKVYVDLPKEMIKNSPKYDSSIPVSREYEIALYEYYCRPKYWV
ncbi:MAG: PRC-barrel domain-containing protein [Candidatus Brocadia sp.]